jgi:hypothetical protein
MPSPMFGLRIDSSSARSAPAALSPTKCFCFSLAVLYLHCQSLVRFQKLPFRLSLSIRQAVSESVVDGTCPILILIGCSVRRNIVAFQQALYLFCTKYDLLDLLWLASF